MKKLNKKYNTKEQESGNLIRQINKAYEENKITERERTYMLIDSGDKKTIEFINQEFLDQIDGELITLKNELKRKSKDEIIKRAYELIVKEEIAEELKYMDLDTKEKKAMLDRSEILDDFYKDWLDTDVSLGEILVDTIENSLINLTKYYGSIDKSIKDIER